MGVLDIFISPCDVLRKGMVPQATNSSNLGETLKRQKGEDIAQHVHI